MTCLLIPNNESAVMKRDVLQAHICVRDGRPQTFGHKMYMHYTVLYAFKEMSKYLNTPSTVPPPTVASPISK